MIKLLYHIIISKISKVIKKKKILNLFDRQTKHKP